MKIGYLKPGILLLVLLFSFRQDLFAKKRITSLKCEYIETPLGLDVQRPRLMWKVDTSDVPSRQTAYRILVSSTPELLRQGEADIWDSGKQKSDEQLVSYAGSTLRPNTRYWWRVEVWLNNKKVVSEPVWFETGKFSATDWEASWITDGYDKDYEPSPMFRKVFDVSKEVASARCYISGLGYYRLSFNGKAVNDHALDPGFTDYSKRVLYLTYDISGLLRHGKNCIGVQLGNGWFNEQTPAVWYFHEAPWRKRPQMIAEIHLCYTDGSKDIITTDTSWKTSTGPLLFDNLYVGSFYDARLEQKGWDTELFADSSTSLLFAIRTLLDTSLGVFVPGVFILYPQSGDQYRSSRPHAAEYTCRLPSRLDGIAGISHYLHQYIREHQTQRRPHGVEE